METHCPPEVCRRQIRRQMLNWSSTNSFAETNSETKFLYEIKNISPRQIPRQMFRSPFVGDKLRDKFSAARLSETIWETIAEAIRDKLFSETKCSRGPAEKSFGITHLCQNTSSRSGSVGEGGGGIDETAMNTDHCRRHLATAAGLPTLPAAPATGPAAGAGVAGPAAYAGAGAFGAMLGVGALAACRPAVAGISGSARATSFRKSAQALALGQTPAGHFGAVVEKSAQSRERPFRLCRAFVPAAPSQRRPRQRRRRRRRRRVITGDDARKNRWRCHGPCADLPTPASTCAARSRHRHACRRRRDPEQTQRRREIVATAGAGRQFKTAVGAETRES